MVARDGPSGAYRLGPEIISLGASALCTTDLRLIAHDELVRLTDESGETATLEVFTDAEVVVLDEVQSRFLFSASPEARTITTRAGMERELGRIRHNGYAVAVDELENGLVAMAAPVRNHLGYVVAALSLDGPTFRLGPKRRRALVGKLCRAANRVSGRLGASVNSTAKRRTNAGASNGI